MSLFRLQNAEMYFAPALEDLCIKWDVPKRTAAALFVALANGAPDLAATGYMFKQGQGDMAFGALLGAGVYVCMNVIGMIILLQPKVDMQATPALIRDIVSFLVILCCLFPIFLTGLTWKWVLVLNCTYALLTCTHSTSPVHFVVLYGALHCLCRYFVWHAVITQAIFCFLVMAVFYTTGQGLCEIKDFQ